MRCKGTTKTAKDYVVFKGICPFASEIRIPEREPSEKL